MKGDFARVSFDPADGFSRVLFQQGRPLLEAEINEQSAIHHHFLRTLIVDLAGPRWRAGADAFSLDDITNGDCRIREGHYYVDGILCENAVPCQFKNQPFKPIPEQVRASGGAMPWTWPEDGPVDLYLDCWERVVTHLEAPRLREVALNGRDGATRAQTVWQVRPFRPELFGPIKQALTLRRDGSLPGELSAIAGESLKTIATAEADYADAAKDRCATTQRMLQLLDTAQPLLAARARYTGDDDPCALSASSEYRGRENQLYRVEIHQGGLAGGDAPATFKWSRENGAVGFRVVRTSSPSGGQPSTVVELEALGRDRRYGICEGDWVELLDDDTVFGQQVDSLMKVTRIDPAKLLVQLAGKPASSIEVARHAILRRWDHQGSAQVGGALPITEGTGEDDWIALERGVEIRFCPGGLYRTGDYWLIPARVAGGDIDWPSDDTGALFAGPHGITHHRAALGHLVRDIAGHKWGQKDVCGCKLNPLCG